MSFGLLTTPMANNSAADPKFSKTTVYYLSSL